MCITGFLLSIARMTTNSYQILKNSPCGGSKKNQLSCGRARNTASIEAAHRTYLNKQACTTHKHASRHQVESCQTLTFVSRMYSVSCRTNEV